MSYLLMLEISTVQTGKNVSVRIDPSPKWRLKIQIR